MNAIVIITDLRKLSRNLKLLTSQLRIVNKKQIEKGKRDCTAKGYPWSLCTPFVFSYCRDGFVWGDSCNISTNTWTSWVCTSWRNSSNYNQKFSHQFFRSGESWSKESWQRHNRWNFFASKFDSTSSPHSERFGATYIDKSPEYVRTESWFCVGHL